MPRGLGCGGGGGRGSERWRRCVSYCLERHQDQALSSHMYLLRETGPTGFLLSEDEPSGCSYRVFLGDPHTCSCSTFLKGNDLCKHICWILLKKFKLPRNHEYAFQLGLVEREISELLQGLHRVQTPRPTQRPFVEKDGYIKQKEICSDDVCSICQEVLLEKKLPVTYCRYGCGNSVHIKCMKIWADHQDKSSKNPVVKCPLCREEFAPLKLILDEFRNSNRLVTAAEKERLDKHLGIPCNNCRQFPIEGTCYKCTECTEYHLCHECFVSCCHPPHIFTFRQKRNQRWKSLEKNPGLCPSGRIFKNTELTNQTEEEMTHLEKSIICTPKHVVTSLPLILITKNSKLLAPGNQCRLCLKAFCLGQHTRLLSCNHKFHRKCIDDWLLNICNSCPIDGQIVYNPLIWKNSLINGHIQKQIPHTAATHLSKQVYPELFIPGTGLLFKEGKFDHLPERSKDNFERLNNHQDSTNLNDKLMGDGLYPLQSSDPDSGKLIFDYKINHHFPSYLQDSSLSTAGKMSSQVFLPSITKTGIYAKPGSPFVNRKSYHPEQKPKGNRVSQYMDNLTLKKILATKIRIDNESSDVTLPEVFHHMVNWDTTNPSSSKRENNILGKIRRNHGLLSRRPISNALNTEAQELSLIMEGVPLCKS
ncbi:E3 ubiquitin-protein ligase ZSWIM2 [Phascolarctos cinereus]|uniref:E3 ubiquitin-protein ligase ZSWIM2 n=1 Tax=Phascolarctos cinereus TaxID=38626 RepID=A0A6P5JPR0_PHACI|nr:E3 ubiquitin-protein ligase ZSWIM2 [Phascolarctos cinereus]